MCILKLIKYGTPNLHRMSTQQPPLSVSVNRPFEEVEFYCFETSPLVSKMLMVAKV